MLFENKTRRILILKVAEAYSKKASVTAEVANKRAIREYGLTTDHSSIGFITPQGKAIDSSGRRQGSSSLGRNIDHRQIAQTALGDEADNFNSLHQMLNHYIYLTGNVRVINATTELNIQVPIKKGIPTTQQLALLEKMGRGNHVVFDLTDKEGNIVESGEGKYYVFKKALEGTQKVEKKEEKSTGKIPRSLESLAKFIRENFKTYEEYSDAFYERRNPLYDLLRKELDAAKIGTGKVWTDFGFENKVDFYHAVML